MNTLQNRYKIYNFILTVYLIAATVPYLQFVMTVADGFLQCVRSNRLCATGAASCPMFVFSIFVRYSSMSF